MCYAIIGVVAAAAISAAGAVYSGVQQKKAAEYNAEVQENNAVINKQRAQDAKDRAEISEMEHRRRISILKGSQAAAMAASGVDISSGSALETLADTAELGELEALTIRSNGEREAYNYQIGAVNNIAQANLDRFTGKQAQTASYLNAASSAFGGVSGALS